MSHRTLIPDNTCNMEPDLIERLSNHPNVTLRDRKSKFVVPFWKHGKKPRGVLCFPFYEAKWSNGCLYSCEYCYLKGTFMWQGWRGGEQTIFSNLTDFFGEVDRFLSMEAPAVLHTGEISDSLATPGSEEVISRLIERFAQQDTHTLLVLTKSNNVDRLLETDHNERTVIGFSINPSYVAKRFEVGAPTPRQRLRAAEKCIDAGYKVIVRVDPMIPVENWRRRYRDFFKALNDYDLHGVVVGTLRAFPNLKRLFSSEMASMLTNRDKDGRWHIEKKIRYNMYDLAFSLLGFERMGVCKETGETWARLVSRFGPRTFICNCKL